MSNDDLAHLNFQELLEERLAARLRYRELLDERPDGNPDDRLYRRWLRSTRAAQGAVATRLDCIKFELAKRQNQTGRAKQPAGTTLTGEQAAELGERRARIRQSIAEGGADGLLVGCCRIFTRLCGDLPRDQLPLTEPEMEVLHAVTLYLRGRYGSTPVKEATHGEGGS